MKEKHFELLGKKGKDAVTGFSGVITSLSFDLYGCIQVVITPPADKKDGVKNGQWFDVTRVEITNHTLVIPLPDFAEGYIAMGKKGAAVKPLP